MNDDQRLIDRARLHIVVAVAAREAASSEEDRRAHETSANLLRQLVARLEEVTGFVAARPRHVAGAIDRVMGRIGR